MDPRALLCNICPRRPTFSDVSHLLTHVSSKAHLSNYFKLQIRSHQEVEAGRLLDNYDLWYKANNLPKLLSDRMAAKESRKSYQGNGGLQFTTTKTPAGQVSFKREADLLSGESSSSSLPNFLDPRLSDPFLSMEDSGRSRKTAPSNSHCTPVTPHRQASHAHDVVEYPSPPSQHLSSVWKREDDYEAGASGSFLHTIPTWNGRLRSRTRTCQRMLAQSPEPDPFVEEDDESFHHMPLHEPDKERADEFTKLKGILWPGMDIFDAATEQMKRKRNQKKDESVLKTMEKTSKCVEPTELVFSPTGILRRQRVISGEVEDSSPLRGESPIPRRMPRPKRVLSQVDPNVHLGQGKKRMRKSSAHNSPRIPFHKVYNLRSPRVTRQAASKPLPLHCDDRCSSLGDDEDDDDFDLTMKGLDPKPRGGFSIFCDEPSLGDTDFKDKVEPALEEPILPHRDVLPRSTFQPTSNNYTTNLTRKSTPVLEKESLEPFLDEHERVEPLFSLGSPILKRRFASDAAYPPRAFLHSSPRFGFDLLDDHGAMAAELPALSKLDTENHHIYSAEASSSSPGEPTMSHDLSPNATISVLDEEDAFERYCLTASF